MPRKRDYKAEYARRKANAISRGYTSPKQEYKVRKTLNLPRARHTPIRKAAERYLPDIKDIIAPGDLGRIRREASAWSKEHSRNKVSQYSPDMSPEQARAYKRAFVDRVTGMSRRKAAREKKRRIAEYIREYTDITEAEWAQKYESIPVG